MSADALGGRVLAEVKEEGLNELLDDLRQLADSQPRGVLGLSPLDRLLEIFRFPSLPSPAQNSRWTPPLPTVDEDTNLNNVQNLIFARGDTTAFPLKDRTRPAVVQLTNNNSTGGKTSLCYLLTALAVLPLDYIGKEHEVIWFDTDGSFSAVRLHSVLTSNLSSSFPRLNSREGNAISYEALRHVHVFRPQSSSQLVSTLASLPGHLFVTGASAAHISISRRLGLIVLDSATAFYWQDRFEAEMTRFEALGTDSNKDTRSTPRPSRSFEIIAELKKLQRLFSCTILFSSTTYVKSSIKNPSAGTARKNSDWQLLPQEEPRVSPWGAFATLSLSLSQDQVRQFAVQMSLEKCQRDQKNRLAVVAKGRSIVSVDWSSSDNWVAGVRDAVNRLDRQGSFVMRITPSGIAVEE